jgi:hypothetical protein
MITTRYDEWIFAIFANAAPLSERRLERPTRLRAARCRRLRLSSTL